MERNETDGTDAGGGGRRRGGAEPGEDTSRAFDCWGCIVFYRGTCLSSSAVTATRRALSWSRLITKVLRGLGSEAPGASSFASDDGTAPLPVVAQGAVAVPPNRRAHDGHGCKWSDHRRDGRARRKMWRLIEENASDPRIEAETRRI